MPKRGITVQVLWVTTEMLVKFFPTIFTRTNLQLFRINLITRKRNEPLHGVEQIWAENLPRDSFTRSNGGDHLVFQTPKELHVHGRLQKYMIS